MRDLKGIFPGVFTMGNMFCGFLSIITTAKGESLSDSAWLIILGGFFDILDGRIARLSKSASRFGVELDSFADFVTFGVAPALMLHQYKLIDYGKWGWILGFVFLVCGAFRLARFNINAELEEKSNFIGLPIPVAAAALATYVLLCNEIWGEVEQGKFLVVLIILTSGLMVSNVEYETMPKLSLRARKDKIKVFVLVAAAVAIVIKASLVMFPLVLIYILYGIAREIYNLTKTETAESADLAGPHAMDDDE